MYDETKRNKKQKNQNIKITKSKLSEHNTTIKIFLPDASHRYLFFFSYIDSKKKKTKWAWIAFHKKNRKIKKNCIVCSLLKGTFGIYNKHTRTQITHTYAFFSFVFFQCCQTSKHSKQKKKLKTESCDQLHEDCHGERHA